MKTTTLSLILFIGCLIYLFLHANRRSQMTDDEVQMEKLQKQSQSEVYNTFWGGLFHIGNNIFTFIGGFILLFILGAIIDAYTD